MNTIKINKTIIDELYKLGLTKYESMAYVGLLREAKPVTGYGLSKVSGVPQSKIYQTISKLLEKNIIQQVSEAENLYVPLPPEELVEKLKQEYNSSINTLEKGLKKLDLDESLMTNIWNINKRSAIINKAVSLIKNSRENLYLSLWDEEIRILAEFINEATERGVYTVLIIHGQGEGYLNKSPLLEHYHHFLEKEIRAERGKEIIVVADRKSALAGNINDIEASAFSTTKPSIINIITEFILHEALLWKIYYELVYHCNLVENKENYETIYHSIVKLINYIRKEKFQNPENLDILKKEALSSHSSLYDIRKKD